MTHLKRQMIHQARIHLLDSLWARWRDKPEYRALLLPLYGRYWSKEGRRAFKEHDLDGAERYLKASLSYRPGNFRTWLWIVRVEWRRLFSTRRSIEGLK
jgi:hypothetical protein